MRPKSHGVEELQKEGEHDQASNSSLRCSQSQSLYANTYSVTVSVRTCVYAHLNEQNEHQQHKRNLCPKTCPFCTTPIPSGQQECTDLNGRDALALRSASLTKRNMTTT